MSDEIHPVPKNLVSLRACKICKLIKNYDEFLHNGCENCNQYIEMNDHDEMVAELTTPYFDGMVSILNQERSWVASWTQKIVEGYVCGVYAINVTGKIPDRILNKLYEKGVYISNDL